MAPKHMGDAERLYIVAGALASLRATRAALDGAMSMVSLALGDADRQRLAQALGTLDHFTAKLSREWERLTDKLPEEPE